MHFKTQLEKNIFKYLGFLLQTRDLILDVANYNDDVIIDRKNRSSPTGIVAIIEYHSVWGEADDLTK